MDILYGVILDILKIIWDVISTLSVIITIICFLYPEGAYPVIAFAFKKIKEKRLKKSRLNIIVIYEYESIDRKSIEQYKDDIDSLFKKYSLISNITDNLVRGNFFRRNYSISSKFRIPVDDEEGLHFTQKVIIDFKKLDDCLSSLFDNIREIHKLSYIAHSDDDVNIRISTSFFSKNKLIKMMGPNIKGSFSIKKENDNIVMVYNGKLIKETIDDVKEILIALADL